MRSLLKVSVAAVLSAFAPGSVIAADSPSATIVGTVILKAADGSTWAGDGSRVSLSCRTDGTTRTEVADEFGAFRFTDVPIDRCSIEADTQGFLASPIIVVTTAQQVIAIDLALGIVPLRIGVTVGGTTSTAASSRSSTKHWKR
jgi:hypothetical protein